MEKERVIMRDVFRPNFKEEVGLLMKTMRLQNCDSVAFDTEFPGFIASAPRYASEEVVYKYMQSNVERTNLIQVGFTVFNSVTGEVAGVWQFNLSGFDPTHYDHSVAAVELLVKSGIDFKENHARGVKMWQFAEMLRVLLQECRDCVQWVTFHGLYDVGYLLAVLHGSWKLPEDVLGFSRTAGEFFRGGIFDLKCMAGENSWMGLEKMAAALGIAREEGVAHQAGSDSLLTAKTFIKARQCSLVPDVEDYRRRLFGISQPIMPDQADNHISQIGSYVPRHLIFLPPLHRTLAIPSQPRYAAHYYPTTLYVMPYHIVYSA